MSSRKFPPSCPHCRSERQFSSTVPPMAVPGELPPADELSISQHNRDRVLRAVERHRLGWEADEHQEALQALEDERLFEEVRQENREVDEFIRRHRRERRRWERDERQRREARERLDQGRVSALHAAPWHPLLKDDDQHVQAVIDKQDSLVQYHTLQDLGLT
ncbi:hypothetical protein BJX63DRAFT_435928 [Aspergillus granulosus]|uniref:Uncharacterized protein n=1 Tax=Aspergillus granulosus TaxID=176169 RepID=A0ABR4GZL8_9EURO